MKKIGLILKYGNNKSIGDDAMEEFELQELVERMSMKYFKKPFEHQATFNTRLRTTGGRYHLNTHNLDFNPKVFKSFSEAVVEGIIKHELCHYHLHIYGKGYRHGDRDFKELMDQVGGLRFTPSLEMEHDDILRWEYECSGCENKIYRKRRFNLNKYVCHSCKKKFILKGRKRLKRVGF